MITKKEILQNLNIYKTNGKPIIVHCSLKAIGEIEGGAETLLWALKTHFTKDGGLLIIPTHTWDNLILDLRESKTCIGVLPTIATKSKDGVRSHHPTHSVTVFGERQRVVDFIKDDEKVDTPTSPTGSYGKLYDNDGYILLIGVGHEKNTFIHCVEEMLGVKRYLNEKICAQFIDEKGIVTDRLLYWFDETTIDDVSKYFGKFEEAFDYYGRIQRGALGNAKTQMIKARDVKEIIELIYKNANGRELLADYEPIDSSLYKKTND